MAKHTGPVPRDGVVPSEYKRLIAHRIKTKREELQLTHAFVAQELSRLIGREIRADSYRKWETENSIVQVDAILPLCDILHIHVYELLGKAPSPKEAARTAPRGKAAA